MPKKNEKKTVMEILYELCKKHTENIYGHINVKPELLSQALSEIQSLIDKRNIENKLLVFIDTYKKDNDGFYPSTTLIVNFICQNLRERMGGK